MTIINGCVQRLIMNQVNIISSYNFGRVVIHDQTYTSDLIIRPNGTVLDNWRRKSGHYLSFSDIEPQLQTDLECIVVGTGVHGLMKLDPGLKNHLSRQGIDIHSRPTAEAVSLYNQLMAENDRQVGILACFHLTC